MKRKRSAAVILFWVIEGLCVAAALLITVCGGVIAGDWGSVLYAVGIPLHFALLAGAVRLVAAGLKQNTERKKRRTAVSRNPIRSETAVPLTKSGKTVICTPARRNPRSARRHRPPRRGPWRRRGRICPPAPTFRRCSSCNSSRAACPS